MYSNSMYMGLKVVPIEWPAESKCVGIRVDTHWGRGGWATPHYIYIYRYFGVKVYTTVDGQNPALL